MCKYCKEGTYPELFSINDNELCKVVQIEKHKAMTFYGLISYQKDTYKDVSDEISDKVGVYESYKHHNNLDTTEENE